MHLLTGWYQPDEQQAANGEGYQKAHRNSSMVIGASCKSMNIN